MQHGPSRLVASQAQHTLQPQRTHPVLLIGDVPSGGEPHFEWRSGLVKNGSSRHAGLMFAALANQAMATRLAGSADNATSLADEVLGPTQPFQVIKTSFFAVEPVEELTPRLGVILPCNWLRINFTHPAILSIKELNG